MRLLIASIIALTFISCNRHPEVPLIPVVDGPFSGTYFVDWDSIVPLVKIDDHKISYKSYLFLPLQLRDERDSIIFVFYHNGIPKEEIRTTFNDL